MHLALSIMHLTLHSANIIALLEAISAISFSPILATLFGSNPKNASLSYKLNHKLIQPCFDTKFHKLVRWVE